MKTCIACKHFSIDPGCNYSTLTQENAHAQCAKNHSSYATLDDDFPEVVLSQAIDCPDYALSDLAKSKGWKE